MLPMHHIWPLILVTLTSAGYSEPSFSNLVLLQQRAARESHHGNGIGSTVPISEKGYQTVAALKSDAEMKSFVYRVLESEARYVKGASELSGLVPFYSGTQNVQSLDALKKELRSAEWVALGEGRTAPLNENGYQNVAKRSSAPHMMAFARRILDADHKKCTDEGSLIGMMPYFDGEISVQTFQQLRQELLSAAWAMPRDEVEATQYMETRKVSEDPEVIETTLATTTLATTLATTTLATTLATTTLATTLATTTLATTLATTTLATTLATTTLATTLATTTPEVEEEVEVEESKASVVESSFVRESASRHGRWNPLAWFSKDHGSSDKTDKVNNSSMTGHSEDVRGNAEKTDKIDKSREKGHGKDVRGSNEKTDKSDKSRGKGH